MTGQPDWVLTVPCPTCGAARGTPCVVAGAVYPPPVAPHVHASRQYMAERLGRRPAPVAQDGAVCDRTWTGPTGVVWDCVAPPHYTDPDAGLCGSGHSMIARTRSA